MGFLKSILGALGITQGEPVIKTSVTDTSRANEAGSFHGYKPINVNAQPKMSGDCMSLRQFAMKGKSKQTGRVRSAGTVFALDEAAAIAFLQGDPDYEPPFTVSVVPFEPATDRQIGYASSLGLRLPETCCKKDVSAILDNYEWEEANRRKSTPADPQLQELLTRCGVLFSKYLHEEPLLEWFFNRHTSDPKTRMAILAEYIKKQRSAGQKWELDDFDDVIAEAKIWAEDPKMIASISSIIFPTVTKNRVIVKKIYDYLEARER